SYDDDRSLSLEQEEILLSYLAGDMPEGDPADATPEQPVDEFMPDLLLEMPEAYQPQLSPDDYRCFLVPWPAELDQVRYVTGFNIFPGERSIVHHVITFAAAPEQAAAFQALDDAEPGPGYTCFGGPGGPMGQARWVGAWVPGAGVFTAPPGVGMAIDPGSLLIMQVHYNSAPGNTLSDRSSMGLALTDSVERRGEILPLANIGWVTGNVPMTIPAGDADVTHEFSLAHDSPFLKIALLDKLGADPGTPLLVWRAGLHMHLFGQRGRVEVRHADSSASCLADVPRWDFNWQGAFWYQTPIDLEPNQPMRLSCTYDSMERDGTTYWGDSTQDEMCLSFFYVTRR
ncbi:MAG: monooxygenase, partial [Myxococcales bacterium]|nr:monooxygenase [Myxococcales bacterium]